MHKSVTVNKNHNWQIYWLTFQTCITKERGLGFFFFLLVFTSVTWIHRYKQYMTRELQVNTDYTCKFLFTKVTCAGTWIRSVRQELWPNFLKCSNVKLHTENMKRWFTHFKNQTLLIPKMYDSYRIQVTSNKILRN